MLRRKNLSTKKVKSKRSFSFRRSFEESGGDNLSFIKIISLFLLLFTTSFAGKKIIVPHDFPTIHEALGEADGGDTVYVMKGVYYENIALVDNVVLMGQDMLHTIIDGRRKEPCVVGADGALITNFTI
ncbi:MAG: hypothetical protein N2053_07385, partial [Chitinispirillaceae bacterium]|nr:hypothetical protein [Chitinispirillaceae bacterium]